MRILLVEDEVELARWVARALEQGGFVIEHVADGLQAEARLIAEEYDAVVLDLRLPGKDGLAVLKAMRGRDDRTPVLSPDRAGHPRRTRARPEPWRRRLLCPSPSPSPNSRRASSR